MPFLPDEHERIQSFRRLFVIINNITRLHFYSKTHASPLDSQIYVYLSVTVKTMLRGCMCVRACEVREGERLTGMCGDKVVKGRSPFALRSSSPASSCSPTHLRPSVHHVGRSCSYTVASVKFSSYCTFCALAGKKVFKIRQEYLYRNKCPLMSFFYSKTMGGK